MLLREHSNWNSISAARHFTEGFQESASFAFNSNTVVGKHNFMFDQKKERKLETEQFRLG